MTTLRCSLQRQSPEQDEQQVASPAHGGQRTGAPAHHGAARLPCKYCSALHLCPKVALCTLAGHPWPVQPQSHLLLQGRLRGEAPLILEIVAALFKGLQPDSLVRRESARTLHSGHRHSSRQARPAGKPAAPRPLARRAGPRHPRFGGVFTKTLDDGVKQCSLAGAKQDDLLGPVSGVAKAGVSKVCPYPIFPEVVSKGSAQSHAHLSSQGLNDRAGTRWGAGASA